MTKYNDGMCYTIFFFFYSVAKTKSIDFHFNFCPHWFGIDVGMFYWIWRFVFAQCKAGRKLCSICVQIASSKRCTDVTLQAACVCRWKKQRKSCDKKWDVLHVLHLVNEALLWFQTLQGAQKSCKDDRIDNSNEIAGLESDCR